MANHVVFLGWNRPLPGREETANELFGQAMAYWGKQKAAGVIESFEAVLLNPHGGDLNGFIMLRGDRAKLVAMTENDEYKELVTRVDVALDGFGIIHGFTGEELQRQMGVWQKVIASSK